MENNKISVKEFIDTYINIKDDEKKVTYISSIIEKTYLGYGTKMALADKIVQSTSWNDIEKKTIIQIDSRFQFVLFVFTVFNQYTKIHMDNAKMLDEFDMLNELGLIEAVCSQIPEKELNEFNIVIQKTTEDFLTNHYGIQAFLQSQVARVSDVITEVGKALSPAIENLVEKIENMSDKDIDKVIKMADRFMKK